MLQLKRNDYVQVKMRYRHFLVNYEFYFQACFTFRVKMCYSLFVFLCLFPLMKNFEDFKLLLRCEFSYSNQGEVDGDLFRPL